MTGVWVGAAVGLLAGVLWWRWLRVGTYRYPSDTLRLDLASTWAVLPLATVGGAAAGLAPGGLAAAAWVYLVVGAGIVWIDLDVHRIPDAITRWWAPALAVVLVVSAAVTGSWGMLAWSAGGAVGLGAVFLVMSMFSSLGLGDVKLAAVTGLVVGPLGWQGMFTAVFAAYALSAVAAVVLLMRGAGRRAHVAFGPGIAAGAAVALAVVPVTTR